MQNYDELLVEQRARWKKEDRSFFWKMMPLYVLFSLCVGCAAFFFMFAIIHS